MKLDEAIGHAIDGDAVLFAGAGFSSGAVNLAGAPLFMGPELRNYLAKKVLLPGDTNLEDVAEAYVAKFGTGPLVRELRQLFTVKNVAPHHVEVTKTPWKRIYTTNYDDVIETAFVSNSLSIVSATAAEDVARYAREQFLCIHLNGFIRTLDEEKLGTELKLTETSYLSASLADSPWATLLKQDIRYARSVFFVGFSLYDLDIRRILYSYPELKEKCFFFIGPSPGEVLLRRIDKFGSPITNSVADFAKRMEKRRLTHVPIDRNAFPTVSIREHKIPSIDTPVTDKAFVDLLLFGVRNPETIVSSWRSGRTFLLKRVGEQTAFKLFAEGKNLIVLTSDLGNGKSLLLDSLWLHALEKGYRVFEVREHTEEAAAELQRLAGLPGKLLVTIENYRDWLDQVRMFRTNAGKDAVLILTARNAIHDVVVDELEEKTGLTPIPEINLDAMPQGEVDWFVDGLNEYGLWGNKAGQSRELKTRFIRTNCKGQIHALLLDILSSPDIAQRLAGIAGDLKRNRMDFQILLSTCILTIHNQTPTTDTLADIWGVGQISQALKRGNVALRQFVDFSRGEIIVKSPIAAQYVLRNIADPALTVSVLTKITTRADELSGVSIRYDHMLRSLLRFSNLSQVLNPEGHAGAVISYYESIKNLPRCREYPLFWLQYAIACLAIEDLFRSKKYFETAYSLAEKRGFDTFQIDNHYARFLLVDAIYAPDVRDALVNFRKAGAILNRQMQYERLAYPYRVANLFRGFLDRFASSFSAPDLAEISTAASQVLSKIEALPDHRKSNRYVKECRQSMEYVISRSGELVRAKSLGPKRQRAEGTGRD